MKQFLSPPVSDLQEPHTKSIVRTAAVTCAGFGLYGLTVGWWRSPEMGLYVAIKMPLLIALTLACNGLLNGLLGILLGSGLGFRQSLHALLSSFAISALILGSVAPVTFFLALNIPAADSPQAQSSHSGYLLTHVLLIGIAGLTGVVRLASLLKRYTGSRSTARLTLGAWIAGNALLGMQFSWILRPFFGSPGLEVAFLRDSPMQGSFVEAVWGAIRQLFTKISIAEISWAIALSAFVMILILKTRNHKTNQNDEPRTDH